MLCYYYVLFCHVRAAIKQLSSLSDLLSSLTNNSFAFWLNTADCFFKISFWFSLVSHQIDPSRRQPSFWTHLSFLYLITISQWYICLSAVLEGEHSVCYPFRSRPSNVFRRKKDILHLFFILTEMFSNSRKSSWEVCSHNVQLRFLLIFIY